MGNTKDGNTISVYDKYRINDLKILFLRFFRQEKDREVGCYLFDFLSKATDEDWLRLIEIQDEILDERLSL